MQLITNIRSRLTSSFLNHEDAKMPRYEDTRGGSKIWRLNHEDAKIPRYEDARPIYCPPSSTCLVGVEVVGQVELGGQYDQ